MSAIVWVSVALLHTNGGVDPIEEAKANTATLKAVILDKTVKTYYVKEGQWPKKLADVVPLLLEGKKDLLDPWGNEYKFEVREEKDKDGTLAERPYIWTERVVGKETRIYGKKPPESKKP